MTDEKVVKVLEDIRELQREHLAQYKVALQNQQEAIAMQKRMAQRGKFAMVGLVVLFVFLGISYLVPLLSWLLRFIFRS